MGACEGSPPPPHVQLPPLDSDPPNRPQGSPPVGFYKPWGMPTAVKTWDVEEPMILGKRIKGHCDTQLAWSTRVRVPWPSPQPGLTPRPSPTSRSASMAFFSASSAARCLCCRAAFKVFAKSCHSPSQIRSKTALSHSVWREVSKLSLPQIQGHYKLSWVCSICNHPPKT